MAKTEVAQVRAAQGTALYEAILQINQIVAALVELDADATGGGVVTTMPAGITFRETGDPT